MMRLDSDPLPSRPKAPLSDDQDRYMPLVRRIAMKAVRSLPSNITLDDILSVGWVGMAKALQRRTADMTEDHFEAYASHRIRGSILDYLRSLDPLSRKLRGASRKITEVIANLSGTLSRVPTSEEVAAELGMKLEEYFGVLADISDVGLARLDLGGREPESYDPSPEALASRGELVAAVTESIEELPERLQLVLGLHYQEECSFREVGEVLGVTESRACQLHAEAVHRIRARLHLAPHRKPKR
jgi:RNA polymerase sigma factor for flagellar operon FliA